MNFGQRSWKFRAGEKALRSDGYDHGAEVITGGFIDAGLSYLAGNEWVLGEEGLGWEGACPTGKANGVKRC